MKTARIVCGLAAGVRSTKEAARGAMTFREYDTDDPNGTFDVVPMRDWLKILSIQKES